MDTLFKWIALWQVRTRTDPDLPSSPIALPMDKPSPSPNSERCELRIEGMTCGSCVEVFRVTLTYRGDYSDQWLHWQAIEGMLRRQPGIHSIKVALLAERGVVEYDPSQWTVPKLIEVCHLSLHPPFQPKPIPCSSVPTGNI
jgi:Cu+-exporting ATPase